MREDVRAHVVALCTEAVQRPSALAGSTDAQDLPRQAVEDGVLTRLEKLARSSRPVQLALDELRDDPFDLARSKRLDQELRHALRPHPYLRRQLERLAGSYAFEGGAAPANATQRRTFFTSIASLVLSTAALLVALQAEENGHSALALTKKSVDDHFNGTVVVQTLFAVPRRWATPLGPGTFAIPDGGTDYVLVTIANGGDVVRGLTAFGLEAKNGPVYAADALCERLLPGAAADPIALIGPRGNSFFPCTTDEKLGPQDTFTVAIPLGRPMQASLTCDPVAASGLIAVWKTVAGMPYSTHTTTALSVSSACKAPVGGVKP